MGVIFTLLWVTWCVWLDVVIICERNVARIESGVASLMLVNIRKRVKIRQKIRARMPMRQDLLEKTNFFGSVCPISVK